MTVLSVAQVGGLLRFGFVVFRKPKKEGEKLKFCSPGKCDLSKFGGNRKEYVFAEYLSEVLSWNGWIPGIVKDEKIRLQVGKTYSVQSAANKPGLWHCFKCKKIRKRDAYDAFGFMCNMCGFNLKPLRYRVASISGVGGEWEIKAVKE